MILMKADARARAVTSSFILIYLAFMPSRQVVTMMASRKLYGGRPSIIAAKYHAVAYR